MTKSEFIDRMKPLLKALGYRKTRNYWHKKLSYELLGCIFVQGSQWDSDDYYVEVGWALPEPPKPSLDRWLARGRIGKTNPSPEELLGWLQGPASQVMDLATMGGYLRWTKSTRILSQYSFEPK